MLVMRIVWEIVHRIIDISALVIEQFCKRNHGCVLEIFAKATSDQVGMYPNDIFLIDGLWSKELRIVFQNRNKLGAIFFEFFSLTLNMLLKVLILELCDFLFVPKNSIINLSRQISNQVKPSRFRPLLILIQQIA